MSKYLLCTLFIIAIISLPIISFSQEEALEEIEYAYGTVIMLDEAKREITVSEYDYESDEEIPVTYAVDPNVDLEEVTSLKEIIPGYDVDIEYIIGKDNKRIAKFISVYKSAFESE